SGVAAVAALVLFLVSRSLSAKILDVAGTETSRVASIVELSAQVAKEIGGGSFAQIAEFKGRAAALEDLRADFSGLPAVWYECVVTREWEEEYWESDKDGNRQRRTRRGSEVVSNIRREPVFELDDGSGRVRVDPAGAKIEAESTWSSFDSSGGSTIGVGSFVFQALALASGARRTLGYRFAERSIPVGRELYVFGEVGDAGGSLCVRKPAKGRFLVSTRKEEAILKGAETGRLWTRLLAGVSAAGALVSLGFALFGH
ncbi:MAG TPA: GIDE domain-containing protein, partial [Rectinemataceae bacterium]|nr:GIDE domain-containing protein [Rectinemataceae bacterium]